MFTVDTEEPYMSPYLFHITHDATQPLSDITGGNLQVTCSLNWSNKSLYTTTENVVLHKTFKFNLVCRVGGVTLYIYIYHIQNQPKQMHMLSYRFCQRGLLESTKAVL